MMDAWLRENLVCPRDHTSLHEDGDVLRCEQGHVYPYAEGLPVMLIDEEEPTHANCHRSLDVAAGKVAPRVAVPDASAADHIDPFVQQAVAETCGYYFVPVIGKLTEYPIPELRMPSSNGGRMLDVGCNWGRWCVAASRLGYKPVGIDPAIEAVRSARRVAKQMGVEAQYIVADARHLPFRPKVFDAVHSYSVLMHFAKEDATSSIREMGRVLKPGGRSLIQMTNFFGLRNLQIQLMRGFRKTLGRSSFHTRYWLPTELSRLFTDAIGPSSLEVEGFFSTSSGSYYMKSLPIFYRVALTTSRVLSSLSRVFVPLRYAADSVYMRSTRKTDDTNAASV